MDPLILLQSMATRRLLEHLAPVFTREAGYDVALRALGGVEVARLVRAGEPADLVILAAAAMDDLARDGMIIGDSLRAIARAEMVAAVPSGRARPDLSTCDAVRRAILGASRVAYSTGPSGDHLMALCRAWGIATDTDRFLKAPPGTPVASLLAGGEADLGFQQRSELIDVPGVAIVGRLPATVEATTVFVAGIPTTCRVPHAAVAFVTFLASPETADSKRGFGLEPG